MSDITELHTVTSGNELELFSVLHDRTVPGVLVSQLLHDLFEGYFCERQDAQGKNVFEFQSSELVVDVTDGMFAGNEVTVYVPDSAA